MAGRTKVERQPTTRRVITEPAQARFAAMNACAPIVSQAELVKVLKDYDGTELSRTSAGFILNGAEGSWYHEGLARVFCDLTGTRMSVMWPEWLNEHGKLRPAAEQPAPTRGAAKRSARAGK